MNRPTLEVADIIRQHSKDFIENNRAQLSPQQRKVLRAIEHCRTAALGGHLDRCSCCDHCAISYNSCGNRHCPKCLTSARDRWLAAREKELLNISYFHVVFTLPHQLATLALCNPKVVYQLLFQASAKTLLKVAADPQASGSTHWLPQCAPYMGPESSRSPARALCHSRGRPLSGRFPMGSDALYFLLTRESSEPSVPRKVRRRTETRFPSRATRLPRVPRSPRFERGLRSIPAHAVSPGLGGLCQAALRWTTACAALSGPIHPSRSDLQPSSTQLARRTGHLSVEGLRPWQQTPQHEGPRSRIPTPLSAARAPKRFCANPFLRLPGQPAARCATASVSTSCGFSTAPLPVKSYTNSFLLVVSIVWRRDGCGRAIQR